MKLDQKVYEKLAFELSETNESISRQKCSSAAKEFYEGYKMGFMKATEVIGIDKMELFVKLQEVKITKAIKEINEEEELKNA